MRRGKFGVGPLEAGPQSPFAVLVPEKTGLGDKKGLSSTSNITAMLNYCFRPRRSVRNTTLALAVIDTAWGLDARLGRS